MGTSGFPRQAAQRRKRAAARLIGRTVVCTARLGSTETRLSPRLRRARGPRVLRADLDRRHADRARGRGCRPPSRAAAPAAIQIRRTGIAPAASPPRRKQESRVALWPKESREVKKPIAPNLPGTPGASTNAGSGRRCNIQTGSTPIRYCTSPITDESASGATAEALRRFHDQESASTGTLKAPTRPSAQTRL